MSAPVAVGCPQDLVALGLEVGHDGQRAGAGDHPVGAGFHGGAGVGVDDDLAVGVGVAEGGKFVRRAAQIEAASGFQVGHQHAFARAQDLGRFAHEAHAGHHQDLRRVVAAEAGHFQRIGDQAVGFQRQILQVAVYVVVGHQHRLVLAQQGRGARLQGLALGRLQRRRHQRPGLGRATGAAAVLPREVVQGGAHGRDGSGVGRTRPKPWTILSTALSP